MFLVAEIREKTTKQWIAAALYLVKGTTCMSPLGHARANEKKLVETSTARLFQAMLEILEGSFYPFKYQSSFDS